MANRKSFGNLLLVVTAAIWGTAFVAQRTGMDYIEPISFTAARMTLAAVAVGAFWCVTRTARRRPMNADNHEYRRNTVMGGILCGVFLALGSLLQQMGIVYTTAGKAGFITAMYMLIVPVISFLFLRKKNHWLTWLSVLIGMNGMYLLCVQESFSLNRGDVLVAVCALFFSLHILSCDHFAPQSDPIGLAAIQFATVAGISLIAAMLTEQPTMAKLTSAALPILYCGIVSGGIGYTLQIVAQRYTDPTTASLLMSLESVFAAIAGAIVLQERMAVRELVGCIVMFTAIVLVQLPQPGTKKTVK